MHWVGPTEVFVSSVGEHNTNIRSILARCLLVEDIVRCLCIWHNKRWQSKGALLHFSTRPVAFTSNQHQIIKNQYHRFECWPVKILGPEITNTTTDSDSNEYVSMWSKVKRAWSATQKFKRVSNTCGQRHLTYMRGCTDTGLLAQPTPVITFNICLITPWGLTVDWGGRALFISWLATSSSNV